MKIENIDPFCCREHQVFSHGNSITTLLLIGHIAIFYITNALRKQSFIAVKIKKEQKFKKLRP